MCRKSFINGVKIVALIGASVTTVSGCSTGVDPRMASHGEQAYESTSSMAKRTYASLEQQGEFTRAALLKGIYDSSMFKASSSPKENTQARVTVPSRLEQQSRGFSESLISHSVAPTPTTYSSKQGIPSKPLDGEWHTKLGWSLLIQGNYSGSAAAYREALRHDPSLAQAYLGLGMALNMIDDVPSAIEAYQQALELRPNYAAAQVNLGYIYADGHQQQDLKKAKQLFLKASQQGDPFATIALLELKTR